MKTYSITTFGCQMNHSDSERVAAVCKSMGYEEAGENQIADLYIINTCSVRQKAEDRVIGMGKKFFKFKAQKSSTRVVLTGCMAKRDIRQSIEKSTEYKQKYNGKLKKVMPWLDVVLEINDIHTLPKILGEPVLEELTDYFAVKPKYNSKYQAFVPISTGCNKFCTFCIVPFTRGKEIYRPFNEIYKEVKDLVEAGYKEITLLGQNVNSWKSEVTIQDKIPIPAFRKVAKTNADLPSIPSTSGAFSQQVKKQMDFADLMESLADIPGEFWLRFTSSHPYDINPRLINVIAEKENIAKQVHFALQSGSNPVLKRMNRYYTALEFKEKVRLIKGTIPNVSLTTDVIVGFPKETDEEFEATADLMKELNFDQAFISEYSQRNGTIAAKFYEDDVPNEIKHLRKKKLEDILKKGVEENNRRLVGTVQKVLIYKATAKNKKGIFGRTTQGKDVLIKNHGNQDCKDDHNLSQRGELKCSSCSSPIQSEITLGRFVTVKITGFKGFCLEGEII